ncbi:hypothetical protein E2C01_039317 [Portunus trituberculatus]|uniref:Uncharacterized protein n=1 Tax=Portunus trituberculatus TaxID=210409 RepID=A0A5B7FGI7_PORTR|nr:hypothetical protein [Portunus trituberculatus]
MYLISLFMLISLLMLPFSSLKPENSLSVHSSTNFLRPTGVSITCGFNNSWVLQA